MKKLLLLTLCLVLLVACLASCDSSGQNNTYNPSTNNSGTSNTDTKTQAQYECGKEAYDELIKAANLCETYGNVVYDAWYFAIYKADDYTGSNIVSAFASETGLSVSDVNEAIKELSGEDTLPSYLLTYALSDISLAVDVGIKALELNGTLAQLDKALTNAKSKLKTMTQEYSDYSEYPSLKSLYSTVDSYATFIKDPSGSFEQLKTTIENYETEIRTLRSDLSFVFDD